MLQTVDRLPIPNKTMVQESRFFTIVERWLTATDVPATDATVSDPVFIDEATGNIKQNLTCNLKFFKNRTNLMEHFLCRFANRTSKSTSPR